MLTLILLTLFSTQALAEEKPSNTGSYNASAGALIGYQSSSHADLSGRVPYGGLISMNVGGPLRLGLYGLYSFGGGDFTDMDTMSLYGGEIALRLGPGYVGVAGGLALATQADYAAGTSQTETYSHYGALAGLDFPLNQKKDVTFGGEGRLLTLNGESMFVIGATLKAWFNL